MNRSYVTTKPWLLCGWIAATPVETDPGSPAVVVAMSSDLYKMHVKFIGVPSEKLDVLPWRNKAVRRFAKQMKLPNPEADPADLLSEILTLLAEAGEKGANRVIPSDKSVDRGVNNMVRAAILHRAYPAKFPPKTAFAVTRVKCLQGPMPFKHSERVLIARWLFELDENHPLRAKYKREKLFEQGWGLPGAKIEMAFLGRGKRAEDLAIIAPPEWFYCPEVGESYTTAVTWTW